jgi:multiple sugar transport system substrate-binding protein
MVDKTSERRPSMEELSKKISRRTLFRLGAVPVALSILGKSAISATAKLKVNPKGLGKMSYWNHFTGAPERAGFALLTTAFKKASPNIELDVQTVLNDDWMAKYISSTTAKSGPDAVMIDVSRFTDMLRIGGLRDITAYHKLWPGKTAVEGTTPAFTELRKVYGVPFFTFIDWMYYRKDLLDAAGIKKIPTTLAEFREACIAMTNPSKNQYGFAMRGGSGGGGFIVNILHAYNGPIIDKYFKRTLSLDAAVEAMRFWVNLAVVDKCVVPTVATDGYAQIMSNIATGKAASVMHHGGSFVEIGRYWKYGTQIVSAPRPKGPVSQMGFTSPLANGLFKFAQNPDAAFEYVSFLGSAAPQAEFLKATGYFPTSTDAAKEKFIADEPQYNPAIESLSTLATGYTFPGLTAWRDLTCLPEFQKCLTGQQTPEGAARKIYDQLGVVAKAAATANRLRYRK